MAIQYAGGTNRNDLYAGIVTANQAIADVHTTLVAAGWTATAVKAFVTLTATGNCSNNDTITVGGKVYTFKTAINNANDGEILLGTGGSATADSLSNLKAALNLGAGSGTLYSTATTLNATMEGGVLTATTLIIQEKTGGVTTPLTVTESLTNMTLSGTSTLDGGYKFDTAITPQLLQGRLYVYNHNEGTTRFELQVMNTIETEFSLANNASIIAGATLDLRVIANKYQCFIFINGSVGSAANAFWGCGVPWIPDFLKGVAVSDVVTSAGLVKITTSTAHNLITGNAVTVRGVLGATGANLTNNNVTVISPTVFTLDGSTFGGTYTSGGVVAGVTVTAPILPTIAEAIWACGTSGSNVFIRNRLSATGNQNWTALNGSAVQSGNGTGALQMATIALEDNSVPASELLWFNGSDFATEPYLAWGTAAGSTGLILGQLWDAMFIRKALTATDAGGIAGVADGHNWFNLTTTGGGSFILGSILHVIP